MVTRAGSEPVPPRLVPVAALLAMTGAAALVIAPVYVDWRMPALLVGATVGAVVLTVALRLLRTSPPLALLGSLAGLGAGLIGASAALHDPTTGSLAQAMRSAWRNSGAEIFTTAIPVEPTPSTIALPMVATWLAGAAAVALVARWPVAALAPPVLLMVGAVVFVGPNSPPAYPLVVVFAVGAAALLAATRDSGATAAAVRALPAVRRRAEQLRRASAALAALAVLGVVAAGIGPAAAALYHRQPADPRAYFVPPERRSDLLNPLGMLSLWAIDSDIPLLEVTSPRPVRMRWAALGAYDGLTWNPEGNYRAAGTVLPKPKPLPERSMSVTQQVTVRALGGNWLPAAEQPRQVQGVRVGFDAATGMVAAVDGLRDGLTYQVVSEVPRRDAAKAAGAALPTDRSLDPYRVVPPGVPDPIQELATKAAGAAGTPYQRALRMERYLKDTYRFSPQAPSGHAFPSLSFFLTTPAHEGGGRGTSEQFATSFALLARILGMPSRVMVGFHAGVPQGEGRYLVRSGDAYAWAEIYLAGQGWVPFDPTPGTNDGKPPPEESTPESEEESQERDDQLTDPSPEPVPDDGDEAMPDPQDTPGATGGLTSTQVAGLAAVLLVLVLFAAVPVLRQYQTKRRLARGSPAERILGAWAEVRHALRLAGRRPAASLAVRELAAHAARAKLGPGRASHATPALPDLQPLARQVNEVSFGMGGFGDPPDPVAAGELAMGYSRALRASRGRFRRFLWRLDPRPLFWR